MGKSVILGIDELANGQVQAFNTVNDMLAAVEQAHNRIKLLTVTSSNYNMPVIEFLRHRVFRVTGLTAARTITVPSVQNGNDINRAVTFQNGSGFPLTIASVISGGGEIVIPPNHTREIHVQGTVLWALTEGQATTAATHYVALYAAGLPVDDTELLRYVFAQRVRWDVSRMYGSVKTAPSPGAMLVFYKNGTQVGRARVSAGGSFTFENFTALDWEVGDVLTVKYFAIEVGTVTFTTFADTGDTITIDSGLNSETFTFGGGAGQVIPGASGADTAIALQAAIEASSLDPDLVVTRSTNVLTIWNLNVAGGGAITKSDADNDYTVVDFATEASSENWAATMAGERF